MENFHKKIKKIIYFFIVIFIIALIISIIGLLMLKYEVEGENNMPFELSQIVAISTAEGIDIEGQNTWNFRLVQNNDLYIHISKNKNYKETEIIKKIVINNIKIINNPQNGDVIIYRPSQKENRTYEYSEEYLINDSLVYEGSDSTNIKELQVSNQGGVVSIRFTNNGLRRILIR